MVLQVSDEGSLLDVVNSISGARRFAFQEPDLDLELTAVAFGPEEWRELSSILLMR